MSLAVTTTPTRREVASSVTASAMERIMSVAARVAPLDSTVLILGESGVGKERMARWLHDASRRRKRPFIAVNCGAFADTLLETELFGHARGAFTGAVTERPGLFEAADGGTLFLDEIGEVSPAMQVKLLRVLQEREVHRVGELRSRHVDVRIVAATNRDLEREVQANRFRVDLYYRLQVVELAIPPLRERPEELVTLLRQFLPQIADRLSRPVTGYTTQAWEALLQHSWPGNIRELEHAIERACAIAEGPDIQVEDLPTSVLRQALRARQHGDPGLSPWQANQRALILSALDRHHGDKQRAAEDLGISLSTLKRRLRHRGLTVSSRLSNLQSVASVE